MIQGSCHCGAIRYQLPQAPETVLDCNCSICRRHGALWAYYPQRELIFDSPPKTLTYVWGDRHLEFHVCASCFCLTHYTVVGEDDDERIGVNARNLHGLAPATTPVIQKNNGNDGVFWTRSASPPLPGHDEAPAA